MDIKLVRKVAVAAIQVDKKDAQKILDALNAFNLNNGNSDNDAVVLAQQFTALVNQMYHSPIRHCVVFDNTTQWRIAVCEYNSNYAE